MSLSEKLRDHRTREYRQLQQKISDFAAECGPEITAVQRSLISRAAMLELRLQALEQKLIDGELIGYDGAYSALLNSLTNIYRTLSATKLERDLERRLEALEDNRIVNVTRD